MPAHSQQRRSGRHLNAGRHAASTDVRIVVDPGDMTGRRVCLFVSYSPDYALKPHVLYHLDALRKCGFDIVLLLVVDELANRPVAVPKKLLAGLVVRKNAGYDFGAWSDAFRLFPHVWRAQAVLLVNDSVFGPIGDFQSLVDIIMRQPADFIGLTESGQIARHYQSYFILLKGEALTNPMARAFWANVRNHSQKQQVIAEYEIMALRRHQEIGIKCAAMLTWCHLPGEMRFNPTHRHWRELLQHGFPYIKVDLLHHWRDTPFLKGWRDFVTDPVLLEAIDHHLALMPPPDSPESAGSHAQQTGASSS